VDVKITTSAKVANNGKKGMGSDRFENLIPLGVLIF